MANPLDVDGLYAGDNAAFLEDLYARARTQSDALDAPTRAFLAEHNGGPPVAPDPDTRSIFNPRGAAPGVTADLRGADRQAKVARLINAYRVQGHRLADVDPLDLHAGEPHPELSPSFYEISDREMDAVVSTQPLFGMPGHATIREVVARVKAIYCSNIGVEYMNIRDHAQKHWLLEQFETRVLAAGMAKAQQVRMLDMLTRADGFEKFLGVKFQGYKRFSLEGGESLIALCDLVLGEAADAGAKEVVIGMAHRGRLNMLLNILRKPPAKMFAEFQGKQAIDLDAGSGDVKYHLGYSSDYVTAGGKVVHLSLCFNPSHLEAVNPVVEGRVRAKQDRAGDKSRDWAVPLIIHGDAAFAGQGVVAEVLNLSDLKGYRTGGTVHVIVNNQIGFTTSPTEGRSTPYSTDVARMLGVPIFHVNGEDPEAVAQVVRIAMAWRRTFHRDVVIDMYCFRRHGHNETDEPAFTQPAMYRKIGEHPGVREVYLRSLIARGVLTRGEGEALEHAFRAELDQALAEVKANGDTRAPSALQGLWQNYHGGDHDVVDTTVPAAALSGLLRRLNALPEGFHLHPKLQRLFALREQQAAGTAPLDWAAAEQLAYATLCTEGHRVRLSGQDAGRGTFSHRHAELVDQQTGERFVPLAHLRPDQAPFEVFNSHLSEAAVLGFDYGYSLDYPEALVAWEAQFGDFANGAQVIIDNFICSGEAKWNRLSGVCLFLPHGYEGQGPEHSSARIERFLQVCAEGNIQCCNVTTPAQLFHLLRRQVKRRVRDPLVLFTPKSLLRHPKVVSPLQDFEGHSFRTVIPDGAGAKRVVLCSGKVYYDLLAARGDRDVALIRVEQTYPFPGALLCLALTQHPGAELIWCQEEPRNMGPWPSVRDWLDECGLRPKYVGRKAAASPATGYPSRHEAEQKALVAEALG
jgi:2-oxoglutarate dehydrogenase E1 component